MNKPLSHKEFLEIYRKVPRLCVDLVISSPEGVLLTLRSIEPWKNYWHFPGGTVYGGETIEDAVNRVAETELGTKIKDVKFLDYIEYPSAKKWDFGWPVSLLFQAFISADQIKLNDEASNFGFFKKLPENTLTEHKDWLKKSFRL